MKVAPSMLSANFAHLESDILEVVEAGADYLHIDLMDGQFVPNISFGPMVFQSIRSSFDITFDVHMMIEQPERYIAQVAQAGADIISVHYEATKHIHSVIQQIKQYEKKAGIVINPGTPVNVLESILPEVDLVLVMSVNPGFGGQSFIPSSIQKIQQLSDYRQNNQLDYEIEVDGGVNEETAKLCLQAGADVLVAGSFIFKHPSKAVAIKQLRQINVEE